MCVINTVDGSEIRLITWHGANFRRFLMGFFTVNYQPVTGDRRIETPSTVSRES